MLAINFIDLGDINFSGFIIASSDTYLVLLWSSISFSDEELSQKVDL